MSTSPDQNPDQIRARIAEALADMPDLGQDTGDAGVAGADVAGADVAGVDIDAVAERLEWAHEELVRALESVEQR